MSETGHVWTAPPRQVLIWRDDDCGRDGVMCLACWCSHCSRLLALMWFARWVLIKSMGSTSRDPKKVLPPRRPTDQHHAISTSATRDALRRVPLALALQPCAPPTYPVTAHASARYWGRDGRPRRRRL